MSCVDSAVLAWPPGCRPGGSRAGGAYVRTSSGSGGPDTAHFLRRVPPFAPDQIISRGRGKPSAEKNPSAPSRSYSCIARVPLGEVARTAQLIAAEIGSDPGPAEVEGEFRGAPHGLRGPAEQGNRDERDQAPGLWGRVQQQLDAEAPVVGWHVEIQGEL